MTSDAEARPGEPPSLARRTALTVIATAATGAVAGAAGAFAASKASMDDDVAELVARQDSKTHKSAKVLLDELRKNIELNTARTTPGVLRIAPGIDGVMGSGEVDDRAAIQAILDRAPRGSTVIFGVAGSARVYRIDAPLVVNSQQLTIVGTGADAYSTSLATAAPIAMLEVQASGLILENMAFSSLIEETNSSVGVEFVGSKAADIDAHVVRSSFMHLARGIVMRGKNLRVENSLFSNGGIGIQVGGKLANYHEQFESRNLLAYSNRFHAMGRTETDASISIGNEYTHSKSQINSNFFDRRAAGKHIAIRGSGIDPHSGVQMVGNMHHDTVAAAYSLDNVQRCAISSAHIEGVSESTGAAISVAKSRQVTLSDVSVLLHEEGFFISESTDIQLRGATASGNAGNGFRLGSSVGNLVLDGVVATDNGGWGLMGAAPETVYKGLIASYRNKKGNVAPALMP